jgi:hypothetical protein
MGAMSLGGEPGSFSWIKSIPGDIDTLKVFTLESLPLQNQQALGQLLDLSRARILYGQGYSNDLKRGNCDFTNASCSLLLLETKSIGVGQIIVYTVFHILLQASCPFGCASGTSFNQCIFSDYHSHVANLT